MEQNVQPRPYDDSDLDSAVADLQQAINQLQERLGLAIDAQPAIPDDIAVVMERQIEKDPNLLRVHKLADRLGSMVAQVLEIEAHLPDPC